SRSQLTSQTLKYLFLDSKAARQLNPRGQVGLDYPIVRSVTVEQLQKLHYDRIGSAYESHYGDDCSGQYREQFINEPMFQGIDLRGLYVLEAICCTGQTTECPQTQGARVPSRYNPTD